MLTTVLPSYSASQASHNRPRASREFERLRNGVIRMRGVHPVYPNVSQWIRKPRSNASAWKSIELEIECAANQALWGYQALRKWIPQQLAASDDYLEFTDAGVALDQALEHGFSPTIGDLKALAQTITSGLGAFARCGVIISDCQLRNICMQLDEQGLPRTDVVKFIDHTWTVYPGRQHVVALDRDLNANLAPAVIDMLYRSQTDWESAVKHTMSDATKWTRSRLLREITSNSVSDAFMLDAPAATEASAVWQAGDILGQILEMYPQ